MIDISPAELGRDVIARSPWVRLMTAWYKWWSTNSQPSQTTVEEREGEEGDDHSLDKRKNNLEKLVPLLDSQWSLQSLLVRMFWFYLEICTAPRLHSDLARKWGKLPRDHLQHIIHTWGNEGLSFTAIFWHLQSLSDYMIGPWCEVCSCRQDRLGRQYVSLTRRTRGPSLNIFISAGYWKFSTIDEV